METTFPYVYQPVALCHTGLTPVLHLGDAKLSLGGWSRGGNPSLSHAVIDLTGGKDKRILDNFEAGNEAAKDAFSSLFTVAQAGPWLCAPIKDYGIPNWDLGTWLKLCDVIRAQLIKGVNVDVLCVGGHGRTGLFASIVVYLLVADKSIFTNDPVTWLRTLYCKNIIDTKQQLDYVWEILSLTSTKPSVSETHIPVFGQQVQGKKLKDKKTTIPNTTECYICARPFIGASVKLRSHDVCIACAKPQTPSVSCYMCDIVAPTHAVYPGWFDKKDMAAFKLEESCWLCSDCLQQYVNFKSKCDTCGNLSYLDELDIITGSSTIKLMCDNCNRPKVEHCFVCGKVSLPNAVLTEIRDIENNKQYIHIACKYVASTQTTCMRCNKVLERPSDIIVPAWWSASEKMNFIKYAVPLCEHCASKLE